MCPRDICYHQNPKERVYVMLLAIKVSFMSRCVLYLSEELESKTISSPVCTLIYIIWRSRVNTVTSKLIVKKSIIVLVFVFI